jgi:predicted RNA-binding Zn-ribbon protein involved in translation (DUF1610 family)
LARKSNREKIEADRCSAPFIAQRHKRRFPVKQSALWWRRAMLRTVQFQCPNCGALYQVIKCEAGPETDDRRITCRACSAPLVGRDGQFVLKYFLLRTPGQMIRSA